MMNPEVKEKWLAALESGKYNHCKMDTKVVYSDNSCRHCGLGVLIEEIMPEEFRVKTEVGSEIFYTTGGGWIVPPKLRELAGLESIDIIEVFSENDRATDYGLVIKHIREFL